MYDLTLVIHDEEVVEGSEEQKVLKAAKTLGEFIFKGDRYVVDEYMSENLSSVFGHPRCKMIVGAMRCIPLKDKQAELLTFGKDRLIGIDSGLNCLI